jgi:hypothetical protein
MASLATSLIRRGRISEPQHRKGRRRWGHHRFRPHPEPLAGLGLESGLVEGAEGWHDLSLLLSCVIEKKSQRKETGEGGEPGSESQDKEEQTQSRRYVSGLGDCLLGSVADCNMRASKAAASSSQQQRQSGT